MSRTLTVNEMITELREAIDRDEIQRLESPVVVTRLETATGNRYDYKLTGVSWDNENGELVLEVMP